MTSASTYDNGQKMDQSLKRALGCTFKASAVRAAANAAKNAELEKLIPYRDKLTQSKWTIYAGDLVCAVDPKYANAVNMRDDANDEVASFGKPTVLAQVRGLPLSLNPAHVNIIMSAEDSIQEVKNRLLLKAFRFVGYADANYWRVATNNEPESPLSAGIAVNIQGTGTIRVYLNNGKVPSAFSRVRLALPNINDAATSDIFAETGCRVPFTVEEYNPMSIGLELEEYLRIFAKTVAPATASTHPSLLDLNNNFMDGSLFSPCMRHGHSYATSLIVLCIRFVEELIENKIIIIPNGGGGNLTGKDVAEHLLEQFGLKKAGGARSAMSQNAANVFRRVTMPRDHKTKSNDLTYNNILANAHSMIGGTIAEICDTSSQQIGTMLSHRSKKGNFHELDMFMSHV